jgi:2,3-bisphosphoglycerate-independent phosphoglycerate mutase
MKYLVLVCEGLVNDPIEELGKRTLLEIAKMPECDKLARQGQVGCANFVPRALKATPEAACFSILGYDPVEFYTGLAPLDAIALGIPQGDGELAFRCDFVTVLDDTLVDTKAGHISAREAGIFLEEISRRVADPRFEFHPGRGYKNILVVRDRELAGSLDEVESFSPAECLGRKITKYLPHGKAGFLLTEIMDRAKEVLDNHEINRVRIDLKENPANRIWLWGQGETPKIPSLRQRLGIAEGGVWATKDFARGLGRAAGLEVFRDAESCVRARDFAFLYFGFSGKSDKSQDLKARIRHLEEFDSQIVKKAVEVAESLGPVRVLVAMDIARSLATGAASYDAVPFLISGAGVNALEKPLAFSERAAAQSAFKMSEGHRLEERFLKA